MGFLIYNKLIIIFFLLHTSLLSANEIQTISLEKAQRFHKAHTALFIDTREKNQFLKATIRDAINIPISQYESKKKFLPSINSAKTKFILFCQDTKCSQATQIGQLLINDGFQKVYIYKEGFQKWQENTLPIMGLARKCKKNINMPYKPKVEPVVIQGVKVYKGIEKNMIDQFWFSDMIKSGDIDDDIQLVDIRKIEEYEKGHIKGAINIVWDAKNKKLDYTLFPKNKLIVLYCNTGMQSADTITTIPRDIVKNVLYFDANIECSKTACKIEPNENL